MQYGENNVRSKIHGLFCSEWHNSCLWFECTESAKPCGYHSVCSLKPRFHCVPHGHKVYLHGRWSNALKACGCIHTEQRLPDRVMLLQLKELLIETGCCFLYSASHMLLTYRFWLVVMIATNGKCSMLFNLSWRPWGIYRLAMAQQWKRPSTHRFWVYTSRPRGHRRSVEVALSVTM